MSSPFDQFGLNRTQQEFDDELRRISPEVEGDFNDVLDTGPYSRETAVLLADRLIERLQRNTLDSREVRERLADSQLDLFGIELDASLSKSEPAVSRGFLASCRKIGNTVLINFGYPPRFKE